jgi:DNA-binding beta-propeller fold protein YncE
VKAAVFLLAWAAAASTLLGEGATPGPRTLPGPQADGNTLLHNQWSIHPVGDQVGLGDFPTNMAVDPAGGLVAVLHAGHGKNELRLVDLKSLKVVGGAPLNEAFCGVEFSTDGKTLVCSGASDGVLHVFGIQDGQPVPKGDVRVAAVDDSGVVAGFALSRNARSAVVAISFENRVVRVDLATGARLWSAFVGDGQPVPVRRFVKLPGDGVLDGRELNTDADPLNVVWDEANSRVYASLWGESSVAVIDASDGRVIAHWPVGLHPNEMVLSRDGRLFVSNGGQNTVAVLDTRDGHQTETLSSALTPGDPPGSTPDSLALSPDGGTLYIANAYTNTVAVFDVGVRGGGRPLGFIPTGWFPTSVRLTADGGTLLVLSARGLKPMPNGGQGRAWTKIDELYSGSLGVISLPEGDAYARMLSQWTTIAQTCRPAPAQPPSPGNPIPGRPGDPSPIRYVVYIIKENRTYDQVLGDMPQGNGDPALCLFPERVTPNIHAISRQFVLIDNFYANAEVSASGHEWSMAGYSSEFVEKSWPVNYGHGKPWHVDGGQTNSTHVPYPSEGHYAAAIPALGYLWDRAAAAGVTYRSYGEFTENPRFAGDPAWTNLPVLKGHIDPAYRGWDLKYPDRARADEFIAQLHQFEAAGEMPRLQIVRLPQDHTSAATAGAWTPQAMVADNDLALGRVVEALSQSRFWRQTAVFAVEDDAQSGPDHVDAHRTEVLVAGAFVRRGAVDSTPYTTCSLLRTIELILGMGPMSQFDAVAAPMRDCFQSEPDLSAYHAVSAGVDLESRNPAKGPLAETSSHFDFSREDLVEDQAFNRVIWASVRGEGALPPAPVHAAFIRQMPGLDDDDN